MRLFAIRISHLIRLLLITAGVLPWLPIPFGSDAPGMRLAFRSFCHQIPERSLVFFGAPMVVCSRCAGIYAGIAIGAMTPRLDFLARHGRKALWLAICVVLSDVLIQNYLAHSVNHIFRITTGFMAGWTASAYLFSSLPFLNQIRGKSDVTL